jgi:hypothetical protein
MTKTKLRWKETTTNTFVCQRGQWTFTISPSGLMWVLQSESCNGGGRKNHFPSLTSAKRAARYIVNAFCE